MLEREPKDVGSGDKTALITGAGRSIGRAIALALAKRGVNVAINVARDLVEGNQVASEAKDCGVFSRAYACDVSNRSEVREMFLAVRDEMGPVSILVNNAAIRPGQPFLEISEDDIRRVIGVTLEGTLFCSQEALPGMLDQQWGRIINVSGVGVFLGSRDRVHVMAAKAGLDGVTRSLALEFARAGVTVNTVVPGAFDTTRHPQWYASRASEDAASRVPVGRLGSPSELADAVLWIVDAPFVTGQTIHVNGGMLLGMSEKE